MKKFALMLGLSLVCTSGYSQLDDSNNSCSNSYLGTTFIAQPHPGKADVILDNWSDFFGQDLEKDLPWKGTSTVLSIKLDAHGCVYPPFANLIEKDDFLDKRVGPTQFFKFSFYNVFADKDVAGKIFDQMKLNGYDQDFIDTVRAIAKGARLGGLNNEKNFRADELIDLEYKFRKNWNQFFMRRKIHEIDKAMSSSNTDQVFFFVAGFNVPYSLQHIQSNHLFKMIEDEKPTPGKMVFVRLLWPSESEKELTFTLKKDSATYNDLQNWKTAEKNKYVANRSYMAGITLKDIVNEIHATKINLISHSHGAVVVTASLMSPGIKIKNTTSPINRRLLEEYKTPPKPGLSVRVFLSAPGIPGESTFASLDPVAGKDYQFFIGYNEHDQVQRKKFRKFLPPLPGKFSSTTLGCNWRGEVNKTKKVFEKKQIGDKFIARPTGTQKTHDIFCYTTKQKFNGMLNEFLQSCYEAGR